MKKDELLKLAGKLATAAEQVLKSKTANIGIALSALEDALHEYNNAVFSPAREHDSEILKEFDAIGLKGRDKFAAVQEYLLKMDR